MRNPGISGLSCSFFPSGDPPRAPSVGLSVRVFSLFTDDCDYDRGSLSCESVPPGRGDAGKRAQIDHNAPQAMALWRPIWCRHRFAAICMSLVTE